MDGFESLLQGVGLVLIALVLIVIVLLTRELAQFAREVRLSREEQIEERVLASLKSAGFSEEEASEAVRDTR